MTELEAKLALDHALGEVRKDYENVPDGKELFDKISTSFQRHYANPPVSDFEKIIRKNFSVDETRIALFDPREEQIRYYPVILHVTGNVPEGFLESRTRSMVLSLIFLVHRKKWAFLEEFIIHGGLDVLASMTNDENLYFRGQVLETFLTVVDTETFDWFKQHDGCLTAKTLHNRLLGLSENPAFLSGLLSNRVHSYPGGSFRALQILAFWISWVRAVMTKNQVLTLSEKVLEELRLWGEGKGENLCEEEIKLAQTIHKDFSYDQFHRDGDRGDCGCGTAGISAQRDTNTGAAGSDNATVGSRDSGSMAFVCGFNKPEVEGIVVDALPTVKEILSSITEGSVNDITTEVTPSDPALNNQGGNAQENSVVITLNAVKEEKEQANALFKSGNYEQAAGMYKRSLESLRGVMSDKASNASEYEDEIRNLEVSLNFNLATALWKLIEVHGADTENDPKSSTTTNANTTASHDAKASPESYHMLLACEESCRRALALDRSHSKALYRLWAVLLRLQRPDDALAALEVFAGVGAGAGAGTHVVIDDVLKVMRRKCIAAAILAKSATAATTTTAISEESTSDSEPSFATALASKFLGPTAAKYFQALMVRGGREKRRVKSMVTVTSEADGAAATATATATAEGSASVASYDNSIGAILDEMKTASINEANSHMQHLLPIRNAPTISNSNSSNSNSKTANTKTVKKAAAPSRKALESYGKLKQCVLSFERASRGQQSPLDMDTLRDTATVNDAAGLVEGIWSEGASLKALIQTVEESALLLLLQVFMLFLSSDKIASSCKLLHQLHQLPRSETVLQLALCGNEQLKNVLKDACAKISEVATASSEATVAKAAVVADKWTQNLLR